MKHNKDRTNALNTQNPAHQAVDGRNNLTSPRDFFKKPKQASIEITGNVSPTAAIKKRRVDGAKGDQLHRSHGNAHRQDGETTPRAPRRATNVNRKEWAAPESTDSGPEPMEEDSDGTSFLGPRSGIPAFSFEYPPTQPERMILIRNELTDLASNIGHLAKIGQIDTIRQDQNICNLLDQITNAVGNESTRIIQQNDAMARTMADMAKTIAILAGRMDEIAENYKEAQEVASCESTIILERLDKIEKNMATNNTQDRVPTATRAETNSTLNYAQAAQSKAKQPVTQPPENGKSPSAPPAPPRPKNKPLPTNPMKSHHPTRLIILFDKPVLTQDQEDPASIVAKVNTRLEQNEGSRDLKVVAAKFNRKGNLVLHTRDDRKASDLLPHATKFLDIFAPDRRATAIVDRPWFKIQVDGVATGTMTIGGDRRFYDEARVHQELQACNPAYNHASNHIVARPRWMRTFEELRRCTNSSVILAIDDEEVAKAILARGTLAAFGRHCSLRAFQDRPPVIQCTKCWNWGHTEQRCKMEVTCRICAKNHQESDHRAERREDCTECTKLDARIDVDEDTRDPEVCPHEYRCVNCAMNDRPDLEHTADCRRCPERLERWGTARSYEKKAQKADHPWQVAKPKTGRKKGKTPDASQPTRPSGQGATQNSFQILTPTTPADYNTPGNP